MATLENQIAQLMPHGFCLSWQPKLLALHLGADSVTALAYATIPLMLVKLVRERKDLQFGWMFMLFGAFILACGATHVMGVWTLWFPDYLAAGVVKAVTAAASVGTALVLWPLIPKAVALPGPAQWEAVHADLRRQVAEREQAEQEVRRLNAELEQRVQARTAELQQSNARLQQLHEELEQRVRDRTRELEQAQAALVHSARQAGMAEIATNVLHNVGNVLNSVNVGTGALQQRLRSSRLPGLDRALQMLPKSTDERARFLSEDPRGQLLPGYLQQLSQALQQEQQLQADELAQLQRSVDHLKQIVAAQQAHAGPHRVAAATRLDELVQDALRLQADALQRHGIGVSLALDAVPELVLDRHRILQILVNLVSNAVQAMADAQARGRQLHIRAHWQPGAGLQLAVQDEGDGIAPEHLEQLFAHGFTTRAEGHGFGLHGSVIAAQEMGGTLRAESPGKGCGATFTLSLPAEPAGAAAATPATQPAGASA